MPDGIVSEKVRTDLAYKRHISSEPPGRHSLIGALASGSHSEMTAQNRLAGLRMPLCEYSHIGIAAPDDHYLS